MSVARSVLVSLLISAVISGVAAGDGTYCSGGTPQSVLGCMERAYLQRNRHAFEALLAPDFWFEGPEEYWGRDKEVAATGGMFASPLITKLELRYLPGYRVLPGPTPETWRLASVDFILTITAVTFSDSIHREIFSKGNSFNVRQVGEPETHYEIYNWTAGVDTCLTQGKP